MNKNIVEIEDSLPNGFHDSDLCESHINFRKKEAEFVFDVEISDPEKYKGNIYRKGRLLLSDVLFIVVEPPNDLSEVKPGKGLWCDSGVLEGKRLSNVYKKKLPTGYFAHNFFLNEKNSFIYIAAKNARFKWEKIK